MKNDSSTHFQQFWVFCIVDINIRYGKIAFYSLFPCHVNNILDVFYCYLTLSLLWKLLVEVDCVGPSNS
jgi:hypothetical protein